MPFRPISLISQNFAAAAPLGAWFLERVYVNALAIVLRARGLRVEREVPYEIPFRGEIIDDMSPIWSSSRPSSWRSRRPKASSGLRAQLLDYLRGSDLQVGLVRNFGESAQFKRMVNTTRQLRRQR